MVHQQNIMILLTEEPLCSRLFLPIKYSTTKTSSEEKIILDVTDMRSASSIF